MGLGSNISKYFRLLFHIYTCAFENTKKKRHTEKGERRKEKGRMKKIEREKKKKGLIKKKEREKKNGRERGRVREQEREKQRESERAGSVEVQRSDNDRDIWRCHSTPWWCSGAQCTCDHLLTLAADHAHGNLRTPPRSIQTCPYQTATSGTQTCTIC